jgi:phospholipase D1/2
VNEIANNNWRIYSSEEMSLLQGHLLKYPVQIDSDGQISSLPDCENFPDAGGKILGAHSATIPDILTT